VQYTVHIKEKTRKKSLEEAGTVAIEGGERWCHSHRLGQLAKKSIQGFIQLGFSTLVDRSSIAQTKGTVPPGAVKKSRAVGCPESKRTEKRVTPSAQWSVTGGTAR